jgi:hypothetical protein
VGPLLQNQKKSLNGSQLKITISCHRGHETQWQSQPTLNRLPAGNLLISAAVLFSGNTFTNLDNFCKILNLQYLSEKSFYEIQNEYLFPTIHSAWIENQEQVTSYLCGRPLKLSGDGRCDSPGFSAKYCTYSIMDQESDLILDFSIVQVTQAGSSNGMEKVGCKETLDRLLSTALDIETFATDRHIQIRAMMKSDYPRINHQFDIFHVSKNITKKLALLANKKECQDLGPWIKSISNHLWWSCETAGGDSQLLKEKWLSLMHHITGVHQWACSATYTRCEHEDLTDDQDRRKKWLKAGSPPHNALVKEITKTNLLSDLEHMTEFCHTGNLEAYHSVLLKYCPKRLHFSYSGMIARTQLAILDHNNNTDRTQATTAEGELRYNPKFKKQNKTWIVTPIKVPKNTNWQTDLMTRIVQIKSKLIIATKPVIPELPPNIAAKNAPTKDVLINNMTSRFKQ